MLSFNSISKLYGVRTLFSDLNLYINSEDKIGLIGSNGSGKSTLLRIIEGTEETSSGTIYKSNDTTVGYLPQEMIFSSNNTLFEEASLTFFEIRNLEREIEVLHSILSETPDDEVSLDKLGTFEHRLQSLDAYNLNQKIERVLFGLGFKEKDFTRKVDEFSGGWKMRILLAKILLNNPSILLLDEPTNHLDLESLQWLESYLNSFKGAIIIVSHDRAFLDNMTNRTLEISLGKINDYKGNYTFYVEEKEKRKLSIESTYKNQMDRIQQMERFIERFRYKATKARQVQSRIKQLEKIDVVEIENDEDTIDFYFPETAQSGKVVCTLKEVTKKYDDLVIFNKLDLTIDKGDRIAIVGPNGAGKSTILKILAGSVEVTDGKLEFGYNVIKSYFAQEQSSELDGSKTIFESIEEIAVGNIRKRLRTILGSFLFSDDDVFKLVRILSGGEKSRVALAKMLLTPANFLIMDEPTNHLDMKSKEILQNALNNFSGTFIIASHDRNFLNPIINKVLEIKSNKMNIFPGNLEEYLYHKSQRYEPNENDLKIKSNSGSDNSNINLKGKKRSEAELRQRKYKLTKPLRDKIERVERDIFEIEEKIRFHESALANPETYKDSEKIKELTLDYQNNKNSLGIIYKRWEILHNEMETIEQQAEEDDSKRVP